MQFIVGTKQQGRSDHLIVDAEDALAAALKAKSQAPDSCITYVRRQNKRGDLRHPSHAMPGAQ